MSDSLKSDPIYPHLKHILENTLSKAVLKVMNHLKDQKSVASESQKLGVTYKPLINMRTRRACALESLFNPYS